MHKAPANSKWLMKLAASLTLAVLVVACGSDEAPTSPSTNSGVSGQTTAQATPTATPEPTAPPAATVTPRSTQPTAELPPTQRPATESGLSPDAQEYIDLYCDNSEDEAETWGEAADLFEELIERHSRSRPPEELREYIEAFQGLLEVQLEFMKGKDSDERFDPGDPGEDFWEFTEGPEFRAAIAAIQEVIDTMDSRLVIALNDAGC